MAALIFFVAGMNTLTDSEIRDRSFGWVSTKNASSCFCFIGCVKSSSMRTFEYETCTWNTRISQIAQMNLSWTYFRAWNNSSNDQERRTSTADWYDRARWKTFLRQIWVRELRWAEVRILLGCCQAEEAIERCSVAWRNSALFRLQASTECMLQTIWQWQTHIRSDKYPTCLF